MASIDFWGYRINFIQHMCSEEKDYNMHESEFYSKAPVKTVYGKPDDYYTYSNDLT
jgi:hypothetical protein